MTPSSALLHIESVKSSAAKHRAAGTLNDFMRGYLAGMSGAYGIAGCTDECFAADSAAQAEIIGLVRIGEPA